MVPPLHPRVSGMVQSEKLEAFRGKRFRLDLLGVYKTNELQSVQMSAKKGRGANNVRKVPQHVNQKAPPGDDQESPNLSVIERASFLEGLQLNYGNPLHSTAMEEDLNVLEEERLNKGKAGRKDVPQTFKTDVKQRGAAVKRKETEPDEDNEKENEEEEKKRSTGGKVKARPEKEEETKKKKGAPQDVERKESGLKGDQPKRLFGKKPGKLSRAEQTSAARPTKTQQSEKGNERESELRSGTSSESRSQEESDSDTTQRRRKGVLLCDSEVEEEDVSWKPSPKKARAYNFDRSKKSKSRKSSSGSTSAGAEKGDADKQRRKKGVGRGGTDLDVVLDAFLDFCEQYRESVETKAVKHSVDSFCSSVKEQLLEKISSHKELKVLKRENAKVASLIRTKTQRLLDAKQELMRAERQMWSLQKEKTELTNRLADLRRGQAFLHDIGELNRQYLDFRHKHPTENETYGASSLPALLLQTKHIQTAEDQLRAINNQLEHRVTDK